VSGPPPIPFNKPYLAGRELLNIAQAVLDGHTAGDGAFTRRCEATLRGRTGAGQVLLTTSASSALEMAALLCDLGPGDEVVMPAFTFVSCATAVALRGARPVWVDVRPDTLDLDERLLEAALTDRTRAVIAVHYAGVACELDPIVEVARGRGLVVIEDAAHGLDARYRGRPLGTVGDLGVYSFHETKNLICGEGGALVVNDPRLGARAEVLREKGTDRARFSRGEVDRYTWQDLGSSWVPSDILAAYLAGQLERADEILAARRAVWARYRDGLADLEGRGDLRLPRVPAHCEHNGHSFFVLVESEAVRTRLIAHLAGDGVMAVFHYVPLHTSPGGRRFAGEPPPLPVTEDVAGRLLRLPLYVELTPALQDRVVASVRRFFGA